MCSSDLYAAIGQNLTIVPVINKVDLVHARVDEVLSEMEQSLAIDPTEVIKASAKAGIGIEELLAAIVERIPPPQGDPDAILRAMIFDSHYDSYRGAICYVRVVDGTIRKGQKIRFLETASTHEVLELGQFVPQRRACEAPSRDRHQAESCCELHVSPSPQAKGNLARGAEACTD